jgi:hypothetical protein
MELDEFSAYVTEILDNEIPPILLEGLNLGVIVSPKLERSKDESQFIIMGVYVQSSLGKQIILYYGSFLYFFEKRSKKAWKRKILSTTKHELIHHIEALAGQKDLANKEKYEKYLRQRKKEK